MFVVLAFIVWGSVVIGGGRNPRFAPELAKVVLLATLSVALIDLFPHEKTLSYAWLIPTLVTMFTIGVYFVGEWDYSDPVLHRFGVPGFGSPNTTAYVLSFCMILLHPHLSSGESSTKKRALTLASYASLAIALIATQSRGGWLIYISGLFVLSKRRMRIVLATGAAMAVAIALFTPLGETASRLNLIMDIRETGGTGRLFIWQQLVQDLVQDPLSLIAGRGPGAISFDIAESDMPIESTHSIMVEIPYSYGVLGVLASVLVFLRLWHLVRNDCYGVGRSLRMALLVALTTAFVMDSYPLTGQILWFTPLLISLVAGPKNQSIAITPGGLLLELDKKTA